MPAHQNTADPTMARSPERTSASLPSACSSWRALRSAAEDVLQQVRAGRDLRLGDLQGSSLSALAMTADWSSLVLTSDVFARLFELGRERRLETRRDAMLRGDIVNRSERRAALHTLLRDVDGAAWSDGAKALRSSVDATRARMRALTEQVHSGAWAASRGSPITDVVNIGIGGSEFGARLLCDSLRDLAPRGRRIHFVSSVDGLEVARLMEQVDPAETLFVVSSKSFSTVETLMNAKTLRAWSDEQSFNVEHHWFAVTGNHNAAEALGIPKENIFDVPEWVGGRFSSWGSVGLPAALYLGWPLFEQWLNGGFAADRHFATAPLEANLPIRLALMNAWNTTFLGCPSHCVVSYDHRLAQFLPWLQQLEMESNGKRVTEDGTPVDYPTAPVVWGGLGNNGQHTYYQFLREGTGPKAITVIGTKTASSRYPEHAAELDAHRQAQVSALSQGTSAGSFNSLSQIVLDDLGPFQLGALMSTFEHATACSGFLWGINSFDQPGVEFGKQIARQLRAGTT